MKTINPVLRARIVNNEIKWYGVEGERWRRKIRSVKQNAYYWAVVLEIWAEEGGYLSKDEAHSALSLHFLRKDAGPLTTVTSTGALSTVEFEDYLEKCRALCMQMFKVYIPLPNEVDANFWAPGEQA